MTCTSSRPELISLPSFTDVRGSLSVAEVGRELPWPVAEAKTIKLSRGQTLKTTAAMVIALAGSLQVTAGVSGLPFTLTSPDCGLLAPSGSRVAALSDNALALLLEKDLPPGQNPLPFPVRRVFFLYGMPAGTSRGAHAHKTHHQIIRAAAGSFSVTADNGLSKTDHRIEPGESLWIRPGIWNTLSAFSPDAVGLVLASETYDENLYLRDYEAFLRFRGLSG